MPRAGALASGQAERQQCAVQAPGEQQGSARAHNHTCGELSSVLSTRARAAPLSVAQTTSVGSSRSWRGAIVTPPRARGVVFFTFHLELTKGGAVLVHCRTLASAGVTRVTDFPRRKKQKPLKAPAPAPALALLHGEYSEYSRAAAVVSSPTKACSLEEATPGAPLLLNEGLGGSGGELRRLPRRPHLDFFQRVRGGDARQRRMAAERRHACAHAPPIGRARSGARSGATSAVRIVLWQQVDPRGCSDLLAARRAGRPIGVLRPAGDGGPGAAEQAEALRDRQRPGGHARRRRQQRAHHPLVPARLCGREPLARVPLAQRGDQAACRLGHLLHVPVLAHARAAPPVGQPLVRRACWLAVRSGTASRSGPGRHGYDDPILGGHAALDRASAAECAGATDSPPDPLDGHRSSGQKWQQEALPGETEREGVERQRVGGHKADSRAVGVAGLCQQLGRRVDAGAADRDLRTGRTGRAGRVSASGHGGRREPQAEACDVLCNWRLGEEGVREVGMGGRKGRRSEGALDVGKGRGGSAAAAGGRRERGTAR
eukprot:scaffold9750_cov116-Isochrysis_galbana.AAC.5